jgi:NAD(P)-dependent dehydrogenase (short-subunit alcohol dehydrogenase family)
VFKYYYIVITGSASGIGFETARQFIEEGATVLGADVDEKALVVAAGKLGDRFIPQRCDVSVESDIASLREAAETRFGQVDVLVNNAGRGKFVVPEEMKEEDFYYHYEVLVKGPMLLVKHFIPLLRKSSNPSILNVSSTAARHEYSNHFVYSTAKAAVEKLTYHLVRDLPGIRANTILPGWVDTPIYDKAGLPREEIEAVFGSVVSKIPCGRIGKPEDIANCILFLSSAKASYVNGACVIIDGGYLRGPDWGI